jgi:hypothetical protein
MIQFDLPLIDYGLAGMHFKRSVVGHNSALGRDANPATLCLNSIVVPEVYTPTK